MSECMSVFSRDGSGGSDGGTGWTTLGLYSRITGCFAPASSGVHPHPGEIHSLSVSPRTPAVSPAPSYLPARTSIRDCVLDMVLGWLGGNALDVWYTYICKIVVKLKSGHPVQPLEVDPALQLYAHTVHNEPTLDNHL